MTGVATWIAVDWGTSNLRLWVMGDGDTVLKKIEDPRGMSVLKPHEFAEVLVELTAGIPRSDDVLDVVACGMVGARQGWREAPYVPVPGRPPTGAKAIRIDLPNAGLRVFVLPGMSQDNPPDVMRGEETQIAGILAADPDLDGLVCMPGTHCKWVACSHGRISSFRTTMTGEVFALLKSQSTLRHSVSNGPWEMSCFDEAAKRALAEDTTILAELFSIRAGSLLHDVGSAASTARLSGLLLGADVRQAKPLLGQGVVHVLGDGTLADLYSRVLELLQCEVIRLEADTVTLAGLAAVRASLREAVS
ncbi:2-dehydro-3-deoxygalactonokinase [Gymnodinialimonas ulvae]|uniref:2-dehydro-3-deoxygalactonokinase n=1 Tax=Gymnodinialimonas ulvae TaxID=3126504 RepID=UPI0030A82B7E